MTPWIGLVTGVRVDHVDGLDFPAAYLARLRPPGRPGGTPESRTDPLDARVRLPDDALADLPVTILSG